MPTRPLVRFGVPGTTQIKEKLSSGFPRLRGEFSFRFRRAMFQMASGK